jgi:hypothetical protein
MQSLRDKAVTLIQSLQTIRIIRNWYVNPLLLLTKSFYLFLPLLLQNNLLPHSEDTESLSSDPEDSQSKTEDEEDNFANDEISEDYSDEDEDEDPDDDDDPEDLPLNKRDAKAKVRNNIDRAVRIKQGKSGPLAATRRIIKKGKDACQRKLWNQEVSNPKI